MCHLWSRRRRRSPPTAPRVDRVWPGALREAGRRSAPRCEPARRRRSLAGSVVRAMADLLSIERALARVLERCAPLGDEQVALQDAVGRVLAEDAISAVDLPPF